MIKNYNRLVKSILMCAISTISLTSCNSDLTEIVSNETTNESIKENVSEITAQKNFAKILSVAATKKSSLRFF